MTRQAIIEKTLKAISLLPENKAEEISDFADFVIKKYEDHYKVIHGAFTVNIAAADAADIDFIINSFCYLTDEQMMKFYIKNEMTLDQYIDSVADIRLIKSIFNIDLLFSEQPYIWQTPSGQSASFDIAMYIHNYTIVEAIDLMRVQRPECIKPLNLTKSAKF